MTKREWWQFLDQNVDGLKLANVPQNISLTFRKEITSKTITEPRNQITEPLRALSFVDRCVYMRICKHGCDVLDLRAFLRIIL